MLKCKVVIEGSRQDIVDLGFELFSACQQGMLVTLKELMFDVGLVHH